MRLAETIYNLRTQKGMSQGDLADALDLGSSGATHRSSILLTPTNFLILYKKFRPLTYQHRLAFIVETTKKPPNWG